MVQIDREEQQKGKNFMKRIKTRCDIEFPEKKLTEQNLVDNDRRFVEGTMGRRRADHNPSRRSAQKLRMECRNENKINTNR